MAKTRSCTSRQLSLAKRKSDILKINKVSKRKSVVFEKYDAADNIDNSEHENICVTIDSIADVVTIDSMPSNVRLVSWTCEVNELPVSTRQLRSANTIANVPISKKQITRKNVPSNDIKLSRSEEPLPGSTRQLRSANTIANVPIAHIVKKHITHKKLPSNTIKLSRSDEPMYQHVGLFQIHALVFAKVRGYRTWPAIIEQIEWDKTGMNVRKYFVRFFGTAEVASVGATNMHIAYTILQRHKRMFRLFE